MVVSPCPPITTACRSAAGCSAADLQAVVIGGHGDTTMIPLTRLATYNGTPVTNVLNEEQLKKIAADTMVGGATLTGLLGTSAWYAPCLLYTSPSPRDRTRSRM